MCTDYEMKSKMKMPRLVTISTCEFLLKTQA